MTIRELQWAKRIKENADIVEAVRAQSAERIAALEAEVAALKAKLSKKGK